ncbi:MAG TPA: hypothetical protein PKM99_06050 [Thermotogota bacterium]|nr:hypothetical protein [Thermotogota bacterium]NLZ12563.1 hypothetical protein [Thermotogaceae bacterium]MDD8040784.1 hypothetical protein [Thermotogota bacterium]MDD8053463.1 hypothetical protein [Thermotogota bacterium]HNR63540.1 hypothetical protein [Thermotogota bacterium]
MKRVLLTAFFVVALLCAVTVSADSFGIGVGVGQPSGLNFRYEMTYEMSLQGGAGYAFLWNPKGIYLNLDLVYFFRKLLPIGKGNYLPIYVGGGLCEVLWLSEEEEGKKTLASLTAIEFPIGLYYPIPLNGKNHVEIYGQVRPSVSLFGEDNRFFVSVDLGVRFHF